MNVQTVSTAIKRHPLGAIALSTSFVLLGLLYVRYSTAQDLDATLTAKIREGERLTANVNYAAQLDEHLQRLQDAATAIDGRLVRAGELAINLQYYYKLEAETGVKLLDLRQTGTGAPSSPKSLYLGVPYSVSVQGTYQQILSFLKRLEHGVYFARVLSANCSRGQNDGEAAPPIVLSLTLELLGKP
jgi:hypothetical protein